MTRILDCSYQLILLGQKSFQGLTNLTDVVFYISHYIFNASLPCIDDLKNDQNLIQSFVSPMFTEKVMYLRTKPIFRENGDNDITVNE